MGLRDAANRRVVEFLELQIIGADEVIRSRDTRISTDIANIYIFTKFVWRAGTWIHLIIFQ